MAKGGELWMQSRICGNEYRTTVVCIDSYDNAVPEGRFYNPYLPQGKSFDSLTQFLKSMEDTLDQMQLPQSFTAVRAFAPPPEHKAGGPPSPEVQEGRLATFAVRILFRQNASWQGSVPWLEGGLEQSFRSALELILLMDSAITGTEQQSKKRTSASSA